jgi:transposase-like protein
MVEDESLSKLKIICPKCQSINLTKNGLTRVNFHYICSDCACQFRKIYAKLGYSEKVKRHCLHLYVEGNGFRRIERLTKVNHNTVINWVRVVGNSISSQPDYEEIPEVAQIDELQT